MGDYIMSTIKANDIQNASGGIPTVKGQKLIPTAWVNFNGIGTAEIRDSEGISSVNDIITGNYIVNFTTAMSNTDYCTVGTASRNLPSELMNLSRYAYTTTSVKVVTQYQNNTNINCLINNVAILGGQ